MYQLYPQMLLWSCMGFHLVVVFISMMCIETKTFHVSSIAPNAAMVVYGILFGGSIYIHDVYTDFPCINYSRKYYYDRLWDFIWW